MEKPEGPDLTMVLRYLENAGTLLLNINN